MLRTASLTVLALVSLSIFAARYAYPVITHKSTVTITRGSMQPTLPVGSLAYIESATTYQPGEIVTYSNDGQVITHRLIHDLSGDGRGFWRTKGDANKAEDANYITTKQILGKVTRYLPYLGTASMVLGQPVVIAFVLLIATTILLFPALTNRATMQPA